MAVRALIPAERLNIAHVNSVDGSTDYESGTEYKAGTVVTYNGSTYVANIDIEDTDTDTPDIAPEKWGVCPNARSLVEGGEMADLETRVSALENTVGDENSGLVKDVDDIFSNLTAAGYGLVKYDLISVTSDGVKTYADIMEELANGVYSYADSLSDDEFIMITCAQLEGIGRINTANELYTNNIGTFGSLSIKGIAQTISASGTYIDSIYMATTGIASHINRLEINSGGTTFSNKDSDIPTNGTTNYVVYTQFKKLIPSV